MKKITNFLFVSFLLIFAFSCVSDPEAKYTEANQLKSKADKYELNKYAEDDYQTAEDSLKKGKSLIDANNKMKAAKVLDESTKKYQSVLDKGFPPYTESQNEETKENKAEAEAIKADVAVKEKYEEAEKLYNEALQAMDSKEYENAITLFNQAEDKYKEAQNEAMSKRDRAKKSIDSTEDVKKEVDGNIADLEELEEE